MAERTPVYVKVSTRSTWFYGFSTNMDATDQQALGHKTITGSVAGLVVGVNSPKPARMRKKKADGSTVSSFVDTANRSTAITSGWKLIRRARARISRASARNVPVYVDVAVGTITVKYAWNMRKTLYDALGADKTALGIKDVATESDPYDLIWGARMEVPRAIKQATGQSTFYSTTISGLPSGYTGAGGELE